MKVRLSLHVKVMLSYLAVAGLVLLPTLVYVRWTLRQELQRSVRAQIESDVVRIRDRIAGATPEQRSETIRLLSRIYPGRLTVVDAGGTVLADSSRDPARMPDHGDRPEVREALATGRGFAVRPSETLGEVLMYAAVAYPEGARPEGVVRVSISTRQADATGEGAARFVVRIAAVSLSLAALLSLFAARRISRPLRRMADAARAFAAGDLGHPVPSVPDDELGELALALTDLAAQLRGRLRAAGADRASLLSLVEGLPLGVMLFGPEGGPVVVNGVAREICGLTPLREEARIAELRAEREVREAATRAACEGAPVEVAVPLPWDRDRVLAGLWIPLPDAGGGRSLALVLGRDPSGVRVGGAAEAWLDVPRT